MKDNYLVYVNNIISTYYSCVASGNSVKNEHYYLPRNAAMVILITSLTFRRSNERFPAQCVSMEQPLITKAQHNIAWHTPLNFTQNFLLCVLFFSVLFSVLILPPSSAAGFPNTVTVSIMTNTSITNFISMLSCGCKRVNTSYLIYKRRTVSLSVRFLFFQLCHYLVLSLLDVKEPGLCSWRITTH